MSNHTIKIAQVSIEMNGNLHFLKFGMPKLFKSLYNIIDVKKLTTSDKNI